MKNHKLIFLLFISITFSCTSQNSSHNKITMDNELNYETIVFGAGCFWCVEAVFQELKGVYKVESGYSNGFIKNPNYKQVCSGTTGYAEVAKITFNPDEISLETLLAIFFQTHDPTTKDRQGADVGTQYRSGIFYNTISQKQLSEEIIFNLNNEKAYPTPIVTEVTALKDYYKAEDNHQDYYRNNPTQGYCSFVIQPKIDKLKKVFKEHLK